MNKSVSIGVLLLMSGLFLISLIPGGPIENRDFFHIQPAVLFSFNIYLTVLGLGSFVLAYQWFRSGSSLSLTLWAGFSYLIVYGVDLLGLFPQSPTAMNQALWTVEIAGLVLSIPLILISLCNRINGQSREVITGPLNKSSLLMLIFTALLIVAFATYSAISG